MNRDQGLELRGWALGLAAVALVTGFLVASINALDIGLIYLGLLLAVVATGLLTNVWGGLAASGVAVFALAALNQYVGIYPLQNRVVNVATELIGFLLAGPVAGLLSLSIARAARRLHHWAALADERMVHDRTFGTLKPEWMRVRLQEEVMRAQQFSRPLSLAMLEVVSPPEAARKDTVAALQALVRVSRSELPPPAVIGIAEGERVVLILPEFSQPQAQQSLASIRSRAAREHFFPAAGGSLGRPLGDFGELRTAAATLPAQNGTAEALLRDAAAALAV